MSKTKVKSLLTLLILTTAYFLKLGIAGLREATGKLNIFKPKLVRMSTMSLPK